MKHHRILLSCFAVLSLDGCATTYNEPAAANGAKIIGDTHFRTSDFQGSILPIKIDDTLVSIPPWKGPYAISQPGMHTVHAVFSGSIRRDHFGIDFNRDNMSEANLHVQLIAGHTYQVKARTEHQTIYFWIEDTATGRQATPEVRGANRHFEMY